MSHATSPSTPRPYGVVRVCQEWGLSRSTCYLQRTRAETSPATSAKRGPKTLYTDEGLIMHIRHVLATSPFLGEGHRKVWARLRAQGIRTSTSRVRRLMRQAGLVAPSRAPRVGGPRVHDGTITTERPNQMGGTEATSTVTVENGAVTVFIGVDHGTLEGIGIHAGEAGHPLRGLGADSPRRAPTVRRCLRRHRHRPAGASDDRRAKRPTGQVEYDDNGVQEIRSGTSLVKRFD